MGYSIYVIICFLWSILAVYNSKKFYESSIERLFITFLLNFIGAPIAIGIFIYRFKKGKVDIVFPFTNKSRNVQVSNSCSIRRD